MWKNKYGYQMQNICECGFKKQIYVASKEYSDGNGYERKNMAAECKIFVTVT